MSLVTTLLFLLRDDGRQVLLAMKKRGFGQGKWNGPGGKVERGETVRAAAVRECREETNVDVHPDRLFAAGRLLFTFPDRDEWKDQTCFVFVAAGVDAATAAAATETDEMRPAWFGIDAIPLDAMWQDDRLWLPALLERPGEATVNLECVFDAQGDLVSHRKLDPLPDLDAIVDRVDFAHPTASSG